MISTAPAQAAHNCAELQLQVQNTTPLGQMSRTNEKSIFEILATTLPPPPKRDSILAAAALIFISHGYEGASMELVAQKAGAARRTLYNQFPDGKRQLFHAVAERMWRAFPAMDIATDEAALADPVIGLQRIGYGIAHFWSPPLAIAFLRMIIGEASRFPEIMQSFFAAGKAPAVNAVTQYITELGQRGILSINDPDLAARHFLGLIDETVLWMRVMGSEASLTEADTQNVVEQAVEVFLGHYRTNIPKI